MSDTPKTIRQEWRDMKRERDEAKDALIDALRHEAAMKAERDAAVAQRDEARAVLRRLRASARDYAWAEVKRGELTIDMRLSLEAADEALAGLEEA